MYSTNFTYLPESNGILINFLLSMDKFVRVLALFIHIFYFLIIIFIKELHQRSLVYVHQINAYGFLFCFHFFFYIGTDTSYNFNNETLNAIICTGSEILWAMLKYYRSSSILLLSVFRAFAVYRNNDFKKWSRSNLILTFTIIVVIFISFSMSLLLKYIFSTTHAKVYCADGYSEKLEDAHYYFYLNIVFTIGLPEFIFIFLFLITKRKIENSERNFTIHNQTPKNIEICVIKKLRHIFVFIFTIRIKSQTQKNLILQLLLITLALNISMIAFLCLNITNLHYIFLEELFSLRLTVRIIAISSQAFVPIVSIIFQKKIIQVLKKIKSRMSLKNSRRVSVANSLAVELSPSVY